MTKAKKQEANPVVAIDRNSLIDATLTRMAEKSNKDSYIARKAQTVDHPHPLVRLGKTFTALQNHRKLENARAKKTGVPAEIVCKPEAIVSFTQKLANNCIWTASALKEKMANSDDWDAQLGGGTGTDCYADACDEYGINPILPEHLEELVLDDFAEIEKFYAMLKRKTMYLPSHDDLHLYHDKMPDPESDDPEAPWVTKRTAATLDEGLDIVAQIQEELKAQDAEKENSDWESLAA